MEDCPGEVGRWRMMKESEGERAPPKLALQPTWTAMGQHRRYVHFVLQAGGHSTRTWRKGYLRLPEPAESGHSTFAEIHAGVPFAQDPPKLAVNGAGVLLSRAI